MKELNLNTIKEAVQNFSSGWMRINEGESAKIKIISRTLFEVPGGDEGLDGSKMEYDRWQCKVEDRDGIEKVLTVQQRLAKSMLNRLEEKSLDWDKFFKGSEWYVERIDQYNWKVDLLGWKGQESSDNEEDNPSSESAEKTESKKSQKPKQKKLSSSDLSDNAKTAFDLVQNNELYNKDMTYDSLKTVISSLTELNLDDSMQAVQELIKKKYLKIEDDKVVWMLE